MNFRILEEEKLEQQAPLSSGFIIKSDTELPPSDDDPSFRLSEEVPAKRSLHIPLREDCTDCKGRRHAWPSESRDYSSLQMISSGAGLIMWRSAYSTVCLPDPSSHSCSQRGLLDLGTEPHPRMRSRGSTLGFCPGLIMNE